jgi:hypothetical protein
LDSRKASGIDEIYMELLRKEIILDWSNFSKIWMKGEIPVEWKMECPSS